MSGSIDWADVVFVVGVGVMAAGLWALWGWAVAAVVVGVVMAVLGLALAWGGGLDDGKG